MSYAGGIERQIAQSAYFTKGRTCYCVYNHQTLCKCHCAYSRAHKPLIVTYCDIVPDLLCLWFVIAFNQNECRGDFSLGNQLYDNSSILVFAPTMCVYNETSSRPPPVFIVFEKNNK